MSDRSDIDASWLTVDGQVINPGAPAGGGGAGSFRAVSGSFGEDAPLVPVIPPPDSPAARYFVMPVLLSGGDPLEGLFDPPPGPKINAPPVTATGTKDVWVKKTDEMDVDVKVQVLDDAIVASLPEHKAQTDFDPKGLVPKFPTFTPGDVKDGKITKLSGKFTLKATMTIQIQFHSEDTRSEKQVYGRGTKQSDVDAGDVTVGFHESCHLNDYQEFLKAHPLPEFTGKVGMTPTEYQAAINAWAAARNQWNKDIQANTVKSTDEDGNPSLTDYNKAHAKPTKK